MTVPLPSESGLPAGALRRWHHLALNVGDLNTSRRFYGRLLGLRELCGSDLPATLQSLAAAGQVACFALADGSILDLFATPDLPVADPDPAREFRRVSHLAFDIAPEQFDAAVHSLRAAGVAIAAGPISRPTGRGIYFYDPDGLQLEIRCDPSP